MSSEKTESRNIPTIDRIKFDPKYHSWLEVLQLSLYDMQMNLNNYKMALMLFDTCAESIARKNPDDPIFSRNQAWMRLACRDAVFSIFHFAKAFEAIKAAKNKIIPLRENFDHKEIKRLTNEFDKTFPAYIPIRNAVAHFAETTKNPEEIEANAFSGSFEEGGLRFDECIGVTIKDTLNGRKYTNTYGGKILSHEMAASSFHALSEICGSVFDLFQASLGKLE